jgi:hypothetical protein
MQDKFKEEKQKVTLYLPQELHRRLKISAAVSSETMTDIAQRAIVFYLEHPDVVEQETVFGQTHRIYSCPDCSSQVALRDGELFSLHPSSSVLGTEGLSVEKSQSVGVASQDGGELVPC